MQRDAARELDLCVEACVRRLPLQRLSAIERREGALRIARSIHDSRQTAQRIRFPACVLEPPTDVMALLECDACGVPFLQVLVSAAQVVQRDALFTQHSGGSLRFQRPLVDIAGLRVIAHPVIESGDAVDHREGLVIQSELIEERLSALQIR